MKTRRALLFSITVVLALCAACGLWLHRERQQYACNRALIAALEKSNFQTALVLVNAGANPNTRSEATPAPTLPQLLKHVLHHTPSANDSDTALMLACAANPYQENFTSEPAVSAETQIALLRAMLSHGANVNAKAGGTRTALNYAVRSWGTIHTPCFIVELLLQHGADTNFTDNRGMTPLLWAARLGSTQEVSLLLAHSANPNVQDTDGDPVLSYAVSSPNPKALIPVLLAHGADPNLHNKLGQTPLQYAQASNRPDLVRLLKGGKK